MTMALRTGSLFTGSGQLDHAVTRVLGGELVWTVENDPSARRVIASRLRAEHGNWTGVESCDFTRMPPVDVLVAGFPCQDISQAGHGKGIAHGERSGLWRYVVHAAKALSPEWIALENVPLIKRRGLDIVLDDLESLGYGLRWTYLRASDVGMPHQRKRWFALAHRDWAHREVTYPTKARPDWLREVEARLLPTPDGGRFNDGESIKSWRERQRRNPDKGINGNGQGTPLSIVVQLPTDGPNGGPNQRGRKGDLAMPSVAVRLLPSPQARDGRDSAGPEALSRVPVNGLLPRVVNLLPTPRAAPNENRTTRRTPSQEARSWVVEINGKLVDYGPAVCHWADLFGPCPEPTVNTPVGPRLSPAFTEWMMGWSVGWVTGLDIARTRMLRVIGNGAAPIQAETAYRHLLTS
jgi:DNA (cytosine-5)-methyltransferase 1